MMLKIASIICFVFIGVSEIKAQCGSGIISFPYNEGFETSDGGWISGGAGND
jgi:hypothetical protein